MSKSSSIQATVEGHAIRKFVKQRLFPPLPPLVEHEPKATVDEDEEMASKDFDSGSEDDLDIICNMLFVLSL